MIVAAVVVLVLVIAGEKKDFMTAREFYEEMEDEGY